jgi:hypothetical protein
MTTTALETTLSLRLDITTRGGSEDELDLLTRAFRVELAELGFDARAPHGDYLPGAKGEPISLAAVVLAIAPALLPKLLDYLRDWIIRAKGTNVHQIKLSTTLGGKPVNIEFSVGSKPDERLIIELIDAADKSHASRLG